MPKTLFGVLRETDSFMTIWVNKNGQNWLIKKIKKGVDIMLG